MKAGSDFLGAFADLPVLLPLVVLLAQVPGYSLTILLASAATISLLSACFFRFPISIQPLKSVAVAAVALGAGAEEIRGSGMILGAFFLTLAIFRRQPLPVPEPVIRSVQTGLGALLVIQGVRGVSWAPGELTLALLAVSTFFFLDRKSGLPLLGIGAFLALIEACTSGREPSAATLTSSQGIRASILAGLVLPQLALTSMNSIAGARLAIETYFPDQRVTGSVLERRLMGSIGLGNLLSGLIHGLPFCHGAGGITAHVRAGARTARMNLLLGTLLAILAWFSFRTGFVPVLDPRIGFILLTMIGLHHLTFATPLIRRGAGGWILLGGSILTVMLTGNLLPVLGFAMIAILFEKTLKREKVHD